MTTKNITRILVTLVAANLLVVSMSPVQAFTQASKKQNLPPSMHALVRKFPQIKNFGPDLADQAIQNKSVLAHTQLKPQDNPSVNDNNFARSSDATREADDVAGIPWSQSLFPGLAVTGQWTSIPGVLKHLPVPVLYQNLLGSGATGSLSFTCVESFSGF